MGKDLAERFPAAREIFERIDASLGVALSRLMWEGPESELVLTQNAQPAILAHSAAVWAVVGGVVAAGLRAAAGHSLGEYSAYLVAEALTPEDAARLVRRRGELMHEAGTRRPGAMAAVLGLATEEVELLCREVSTGEEVAVAANLNAPDQTVVSGDPAAVERAAAACKARGAKRVVPLKVSGAFHSPLMAPAAQGLEQALAQTRFGEPRVPVIANATATPVTTSHEARRLLAEQLTAPVRWVASMERAAALAPGARFLEIGPGNVLSGLVKRIVPGAATLTLGTADAVERFLAGESGGRA
jgi:[acyl-carrier-protein] S-malonyltransferase